jgi:hypothetical protein
LRIDRASEHRQCLCCLDYLDAQLVHEDVTVDGTSIVTYAVLGQAHVSLPEYLCHALARQWAVEGRTGVLQ